MYDYIDIHVPTSANMYGKRLKCYAPIGYAQQVSDAPESNPQNIVFGPSDYLTALVEDVEAAQSSVVISCDTLQYVKGPLARALQALSLRGVECCVLVRKASGRDEDFSRAGVRVIQRASRILRSAIIDRSLLWFGRVELTGGGHREDDSVMRALALAIASEMLGYLLEK